MKHFCVAGSSSPSPTPTLLDALRRGGVAEVAPNGVLGDPAGASADEGRRLLARLVELAGEP